MDSVIPSDPFLSLAFYGAIVAALIVAILGTATFELRYKVDRERRSERALTERWQPAFLHALEGEPFVMPRFRRNDWGIVLRIWLTFTQSVRGRARERLQRLAVGIHLDHVAIRLAGKRKLSARILGVVALGEMKATEFADDLAAIATGGSRPLAALAVRSLMQAAPERGLPLLTDAIARDDRLSLQPAAMLESVPADMLRSWLRQALDRATPATLPRLIGLIGAIRASDAWPMLAPYLTAAQPEDVVCAALKACADPQAVPAARRLARDGRWAVRAQAAAALGRLGGESEMPLLQTMLKDSEWWVRYRAATALASLPGMSGGRLTDILQQQQDSFAADILAHVLAERRLATP